MEIKPLLTTMIVMTTGIAVLSACDKQGNETPMPTQRPPDLTVTYEWREGSMPPPYHYEYTVVVGPGAQGRVMYRPDYPSDKVPTWTETFSPTDAQLNRLYTILLDKKVFSSSWRKIEDPPVGGSVEWAEIRGGGRQVAIPSFPEEQQASQAADVYSEIKSLVPQSVWDKLEAQRKSYHEAPQRTPTP